MYRIALNRMGLLCAALAFSSAAASCGRVDKRPGDETGDFGTVQLALTTPDGQTISSLNYTVTNAAGAVVVNDVLNVSSPYATASVEISLRAGAGYSIAMTATTSGGSSCAGSATFSVVAAQTAPVALTLTCGGGGDGGENNGHVVIDATVVSGPGSCPDISTATVGPLQVAVGDSIALTATASAMDVSFAWTSTSGTITAPAAASTTLQCTAVGMVQVSLTVSRGTACSDSETFSVNCVQNLCGDLGRNCHVVDTGTGVLSECHSLGHAGDPAMCEARRDECINACGAALCTTLGSTCHNVDPGSGPLHDCHVLGHAGDAAACFARGRECFDLCTAAQGTGGAGGGAGAGGAGGAAGSGGAAGTGGAAGATGGAPAGAGGGAGAAGTGGTGGAAGAAGGAGQGGAGGQSAQPVTITFRAAVGTLPFACGQTYANQGTAGTSVTPRDFRFYVQDVRLIDAAGQEVPVTLDVRAPWQAATVALLDFENGQGSCLDGDAGTNMTITGTVPAGQYTGVAFRNGVPLDLNHDDPTTLPAPLRAPRMQWSWLTGFRFVKANLVAGAAQQAAETGSTGCSGDPGQGTVTCTRPNRSNVVLTGFNPATNVIVADIGAIFASFNLSQTNECHGTGAVCGPMYTALGVDPATGAALATQVVYRVE
jgi:uncharacterized repeat protein (TIGR04052 family)